MRESGHSSAALTHLEDRDRDICDRLALIENKGESIQHLTMMMGWSYVTINGRVCLGLNNSSIFCCQY